MTEKDLLQLVQSELHQLQNRVSGRFPRGDGSFERGESFLLPGDFERESLLRSVASMLERGDSLRSVRNLLSKYPDYTHRDPHCHEYPDAEL